MELEIKAICYQTVIKFNWAIISAGNESFPIMLAGVVAPENTQFKNKRWKRSLSPTRCVFTMNILREI